MNSKERILSVDVLRGFDMFWLIGGTGLALAIVKMFGQGVQNVLLPQLDHANWIGFTFYDLIFPLFEFVMGMSIIFSLSGILQKRGKVAAYKRLLRRFILLFVLGIIYYGGISGGYADVRIFGVLQRLAVTYLLAGILFIHLKPMGLIITSVIILLAYWILNVFVPVPGTGIVSMTVESNWAQYIDSIWLPGRKFDGNGTWDVNGILSTFPATVSCVLGIFASFILLDKKVNDIKKVYYLAGLGITLLVIGLIGSASFPVIKKIWSSTYVLVAGGLSFMLMGLFYWIIDVRGYKKWTLIFVWIGVNPITIYMLRKLMDFNKIATYIVGGTTDLHSPDTWGYLLVMAVSTLLSLLLLRFLYNNKIFIKV
ncbi:MAG: DUF5009 domain-containing protein [Bacteroidota bacterium]|nr:DUF5009 domain-containing protein [Bacteroidota bacterium]